MKLEANSQAILLLTMRFSPGGGGDPTPLTPTEYGRFSRWLHAAGCEPADLISRFTELKSQWTDPKKKITVERLEYLLGRGAAMALALETWSSAGIWIITRADSTYPERLKRKLREVAPPVVLGVGNQRLLNAGGLAVVGSRKVDDDDREFTKQLAHTAARAGLNLVSGGAKGVDETAMLGALEAEGTAVGVLSHGLLSAALSGKWRPFVKKRDLCLISTFYPEAAFQVGNAMGRNKYIYCLADHAVVVRSEEGKGGTWAGASEALKKGLAPVLVRGDSNASGNKALQGLGSRQLQIPADDSDETGAWLLQALKISAAPEPPPVVKAVSVSQSPPRLGGPGLFYRVFVEYMERTLADGSSVTLKELKERHPDLAAKQVTDWLARAVEEEIVDRVGRAHKYALKAKSATQQSLFGSG